MSSLIELQKKANEDRFKKTHQKELKRLNIVNTWFDNFCVSFIRDNKWEKIISKIEKEIINYETNHKLKYTIFICSNCLEPDEHNNIYDTKNIPYSLPSDLSYQDIIHVLGYGEKSKLIKKSGHKLNNCTIGLKLYLDCDNKLVNGFEFYLNCSYNKTFKCILI